MKALLVYVRGGNLSDYMFLEDLELFLQNDIQSGLTLDDITIILLLFADDMVILGKPPHDLQNNIDLLHDYCTKWGLHVNTKKDEDRSF